MVRRTPGQVGPSTVAGVDPAVAQARRVVGLYGDPDVTWSVVLALRLRTPVTAGELTRRARTVVEEHPHLGDAPSVGRCGTGGEPEVLDALANEPYADHDQLVRVVLSDDGRDLYVAAHHGVVDGLGLLGLASRLLDVPLESTARGIAREAEPTGFARRSVARLGEALFRPPVRVTGDRDGRTGESGDWLLARGVDVARTSSAALVRAAVDLVPDRAHRRALVVSMGLSRRPGSPVPAPDRDTAYVRLPAAGVRSVEDARRVMATTAPEPAFPVTAAGGLGPRVARLLSKRLGATVLVSNLGRVDQPDVESIRFWPVPTGPAGLCLGLASTGSATTLTLRGRRRWFSREAADLLADRAARGLAAAQ